MKVLLLQLDGQKFPNLALMRIAAHHREKGNEVELAQGISRVERGLFDNADRIYASLIFNSTRPKAVRLQQVRPDAIIGGSGWDLELKLEQHGIFTKRLDYSIYPRDPQHPDQTLEKRSFGFTERGCRLECKFCIVPIKEGKVTGEATIADIWRGDPYPREIVLLDNDFFGQPDWRGRVQELRDGNFKVSFSQGINARLLNDEAAEAIASVRYFDNKMQARRIYTAWDNRRDERRLFTGLEALLRNGVRRRHIMVYMLIGFGPHGDTIEDWLFRQQKLQDFGALPYPMPYDRTNPTQSGFQRWVVNGYARRGVPWASWIKAHYQPRNLGFPAAELPFADQ